MTPPDDGLLVTGRNGSPAAPVVGDHNTPHANKEEITI